MKILSFQVTGFLGREKGFEVTLNPDLNILTGRNGSGKTNLLKLIWYIISGNILLALQEVQFQRAVLTTDAYECVVTKLGRVTCKVELTPAGGDTMVFEDIVDGEDDVVVNAEDEANPLLSGQGSSVFLPTFRRIEGGFSIDPTLRPSGPQRVAGVGRVGRNDIEDALVALARKLSNGNHIFVTAISTVDIVGLLLRQFTDLSEVSNRLQQTTSQEIIQRIKSFKQDEALQPPDDAGAERRLIDAVSVLDEISSGIVAMEKRRETIMTPITAVQTLVQKLIRPSGIRFDARLSFGEAATL